MMRGSKKHNAVGAVNDVFFSIFSSVCFGREQGLEYALAAK